MTRECTREQITTSYDSFYMGCTPGYIRWRSSRRLESRRRRRTDDARDRGRGNETFPSPGDGDDRTTSPSVRVIQPSSRALANRMNDRPTIRGENGPSSRVSILGRPRRPRRPRRPDVDVDAGVGSRRRPHRTERDASTRSRSNRPFESSRSPLLIVVHTRPGFSFRARGRDECVMHTHTLNRVRRSTSVKANAKARGRRHERARGGLIFVSRRHSSSRGRGDEQSRP